MKKYIIYNDLHSETLENKEYYITALKTVFKFQK